jgi:hypothetical protein
MQHDGQGPRRGFRRRYRHRRLIAVVATDPFNPTEDAVGAERATGFSTRIRSVTPSPPPI